jgi:plasmid stabilization system protein ParE
MNYAVDLSLKARLELFETRLWYEERQKGLGKRFREDVFRKIDLIQSNPLHYPLKNGLREAETDVFPYLIVYKVVKSKNLILIVSVFHMKRHPKKKKR